MNKDKPEKKLILGTRGSPLALTQSKWVAKQLEENIRGLEVEIKIIRSTGDADQKTSLTDFPTMGVFVKELQQALLDKTIDLAVHSLKDVPEEGPAGLELCAFPQREDARDAFISKGAKLLELPQGAKVGTGSPRRQVQLKKIRPDLEFHTLRGNIDTRLAKLESGEMDAIILACAGLKRLGLEAKITQRFSFAEMIPAVGQGILAIECRAHDEICKQAVSHIDDFSARLQASTERLLMARLGGGCKVPLAAHAYDYMDGLRLIAMLADPKSGRIIRVEQSASLEDWEELAVELAQRLEDECSDVGIPIPKNYR